MKKTVPDPPPATAFYASIHPDLYPPDALAHNSELLREHVFNLMQVRLEVLP